MKIVGIYKITNLIDGKIYVGQTVNYRKRKNTHLASLKRGKHHNSHLQRAFNKYGESSFEIELIKECKISELDSLEKEYIEKLNCLSGCNGYNLMDGGQKFRNFTPEVRRKMSLAGKGRVFTEEHKKRISEAQKGRSITIASIQKANKTKKIRRVHCGEKNPNALISNEVAKQIIVELLNNETVSDISEKYQVSSDTVYNLMYNRTYQDSMVEVREELKNRATTNNENKIDMAIKMYLEGKSQNAISKELKISRNTLRKELQERNINTQIYINQYIKQTNTEVIS